MCSQSPCCVSSRGQRYSLSYLQACCSRRVSEVDSCPFLSPLQPDVSVLLPLDDPAMHQPLSANMGVSMRGLEIFY